MAREERDLEVLERVRNDIAACQQRLTDAIDRHKKAGLSTIFLHWDTMDTVVLPKLIDWSAKAYVESISECDSAKSGLRARSAIEMVSPRS